MLIMTLVNAGISSSLVNSPAKVGIIKVNRPMTTATQRITRMIGYIMALLMVLCILFSFA